MRWEELTVPEFAEAVVAAGRTVIIPIGVLEPHGSHLPLGQDMLGCHWVACRAAEQEPVVVYPPCEWGVNHDAATLPGAVRLRRDVVLALLDNLCEEMGRNGFRKIVLLSGHGGNRYLLPFFAQTVVEQRRPYVVYFANVPFWPGAEEVKTTEHIGHGCELETSTALYMFPELVKMDAVPHEPHPPLPRGAALGDAGAYNFYGWYAAYPEMYVGDAHPATAAKGKVVMDAHVAAVVRVLRAVKEDTETDALQTEYYARVDHPQSTYDTNGARLRRTDG